MGMHGNDVPVESLTKSLKVHTQSSKTFGHTDPFQSFWASLIVYYLSLGLTKTSILLQYRRVFTTKRFQLMCWILMTVVVTYTCWTVFSSIFACTPIQDFWMLDVPNRRCINQFAMWL